MNIFLFIDLNSYFASAEQQARPSLRGLPVGVCEHSGGIILAASREAKALGIKTGTPTWEAVKICSKIVLLPVDPDKIRELTSRFYRIAEEYSSAVEHISVDEVSINLTGLVSSWEQAIDVAKEIKRKLRGALGEWMTCSIGIGPSRLLAKIGTELQKPDGLVLITDNDFDRLSQYSLSGSAYRRRSRSAVKHFTTSQLYDILDLQDIPGIGKGFARSLQTKGITTLRQLADIPQHTLHVWYGVSGLWLYDLAHFKDAWRFVDLDNRPVRSIGHQYSLGQKGVIYKFEEVKGLVSKLTEKVTLRLRNQGLAGNVLHLYVRFAKGGGMGGSRKIGNYLDDTASVMKVLQSWLDRIFWGQTSNQQRGLTPNSGISFVSVAISGLVPKMNQGVLFPFLERSDKINKAMDKINSRYGEFALKYGQTLTAGDKASDTVGFGRVRERTNW